MESLKSIYNNMSDMSKLLIKMLLGIVGALIVLFLVVLLLRIVRGGQGKNVYAKVENTMQKAAQKYYRSNKDQLPEIGEETEITAEQLASEEYMKELDKYFNKNTSCTGVVTVTNNNDYYAYIPSLDCGEKYATKFLTDEIIANNPVVENDSGLNMDEEGNYIFKGEYVNNYLQFANLNFRILRINSDGTIRVMLQEPLKEYRNSCWDDRYNVDTEATSGINNYEVSRIREKLNIIYNDENVFSKEAKAYISPQTLCIGGRSEDSTDFSGAEECSETLENEYIGLLQVNEYLLASLDENCDSTTNQSCSNYNYLAKIGKSFWTITPFAEDSYHNYRISKYPYTVRTTNVSNLLFTLNLSNKTKIDSGTGTSEDPFIVKVAKEA